MLLVAGGIGITPIVGMALTLAARGATLGMRYAARDDAELVFADTLRATLGDRLRTFADARGERMDLDAEIAALPARGQLLVCGPVPLLQAAQDAWQRAGRRRRRPALRDVRLERQPCRRCRSGCGVLRHGVELEVPADRSLLEVLEEKGVEALYDCRRGECGLCAVDIVEVHGTVDHRDVFLSAAEKRANHRMCACVSRGERRRHRHRLRVARRGRADACRPGITARVAANVRRARRRADNR